jgi:hypothetical protein
MYLTLRNYLSTSALEAEISAAPTYCLRGIGIGALPGFQGGPPPQPAGASRPILSIREPTHHPRESRRGGREDIDVRRRIRPNIYITFQHEKPRDCRTEQNKTLTSFRVFNRGTARKSREPLLRQATQTPDYRKPALGFRNGRKITSGRVGPAHTAHYSAQHVEAYGRQRIFWASAWTCMIAGSPFTFRYTLPQEKPNLSDKNIEEA